MNEIKQLTMHEKSEILMDAIYKTIKNTQMEYDFNDANIIGCLDIVKGDFKREYFAKRYSSE